jgi:hypothetical protein
MFVGQKRTQCKDLLRSSCNGFKIYVNVTPTLFFLLATNFNNRSISPFCDMYALNHVSYSLFKTLSNCSIWKIPSFFL